MCRPDEGIFPKEKTFLMQNAKINGPATATFALLALIWGSSFILMLRGLDAFSPLQIAALRIVIAAIVMIPFLIGRAREVPKEVWKYIVGIGICGNALPAFLFPLAETHITSASAGILNALSPIWVLILGALFFGFSFTRTQLVGIILGFTGAVILVLSGEEKVDIFQQLQYASLIIIATIGYGLSTNLMKKCSQTPTVLVSGFALLFVAVPYGIYLLADSTLVPIFNENPKAWISFGYIAILGAVGTAFALILYFRLVKITAPIMASSIAYIIPIVALLIGWQFAGETITWTGIGGMVIILIGVYLVNKKTV